jgi:hypothetical protein
VQVPPTVIAPTVTNLAFSSATLGATVSSEGGSTVTERGVVYALTATNSNPSIGGAGVTKLTAPGTLGTFTVDVSSLTPSTSYTFAAYAINPLGTTYTIPATTFVTPATAPEINVQGNGLNIVNGDASPATADHTDFGTTGVTGGSVMRTFTIANEGNASLNLTGTAPNYVTLAGSGDFTVTTQPSTPVTAAGSTTFQITFDPSSAGPKTATVSIPSNDTSEPAYTFTISGEGLISPPEIAVEGNATNIADGDTTPSTADHTDFGATAVAGGTLARTFTIKNTGPGARHSRGSKHGHDELSGDLRSQRPEPAHGDAEHRQ